MYLICRDCKFSDAYGAVFRTELWFEYACPKCGSKYVWLCRQAFKLENLVVVDYCIKCKKRFNCWTGND